MGITAFFIIYILALLFVLDVAQGKPSLGSDLLDKSPAGHHIRHAKHRQRHHTLPKPFSTEETSLQTKSDNFVKLESSWSEGKEKHEKRVSSTEENSLKEKSSFELENDFKSEDEIEEERRQRLLDRPQSDGSAFASDSVNELDDPEGRPADNATLMGYIKSNCSSCLQREEAKIARIERIKADLIAKLGFSSSNLPNASASRDVPSLTTGPLRDILRGYGLQSDSSGDPVYKISLDASDTSAKTERIYSFARISPPEFSFPDELNSSYFEFSRETRENDVTSAKLNLYLKKPSGTIQDTFIEVKVELYRITGGGKVAETPFKTQKERFDPRHGRWVTIPIRRQVGDWFRKPEKNKGIHVMADFRGENLAVHPKEKDGKKNMYLDIITKEGEKSIRKRRDVQNMVCTENGEEKRCCRYKLVIDFEEFGWDWVIAPKKYLAHYCSGDCPFRYLQRYVHTHLVSQALPDGSAGPCCYPTELAPIMMVYLNDQKEVLVSQVPGMVANRCGCA